MAADISTSHLGLGLDAGGTQTRWAVADASGAVCAEGAVAGLSALQLADGAGRAHIAAALRDIAAAAGPVVRAVAGLTGFDGGPLLPFTALAAAAFGIAADAVRPVSDIELACHAAFAPGQGCVVYAGTGSVAAFIDTQGTLHRAGGHGAVIDDAGGGHWIAREALRRVWRAEDEAPGASACSPLAQALFSHIGGSDWAATRTWVYAGGGASRGGLGTLALAVAAAAAADPAALNILQAAGAELARLARALHQRHGPSPVALAGRVFDLHPAVAAGLRAALPADISIRSSTTPAHHAAARLAASSTLTP